MPSQLTEHNIRHNCKTLPVHLPEADCSIFTLSSSSVVGCRLSRFVTINSTSIELSMKVRNLTSVHHNILSASSVHHQFISIASSVHHPCIISTSSLHNQRIIRASSLHHQLIISTLSVHHQCIFSASSGHHQRIISASSAHHQCIM